MEATAIIGAIVSVAGGIISVTFGVVAMCAQARQEVGDLYDRMVQFRTEHPEVLRLSREWTHDLRGQVYGQAESTDNQWVVYYSFVELCLGYCNAVLLSRRRLGWRSYRDQHKPLVKLLLTENNPMVEDLLEVGEYISPLIRPFRDKLERKGWNWREEHAKLVL